MLTASFELYVSGMMESPTSNYKQFNRFSSYSYFLVNGSLFSTPARSRDALIFKCFVVQKILPHTS
jgi:hypothetical protein